MQILFIPLLLLVYMSPGFGTAADAHYKAWQWQRVIIPDRTHPADEQCVVLDAAVYRAAAPGLRDVRLLQNGREVAYALQESYDERAQRVEIPGQHRVDRSLYSTVLEIPLKTLTSAAGNTLEQGASMLERRVPVERMELVSRAAESAASTPSATTVHLHLLATPTGSTARTALMPREGEVIDEELDPKYPVELTAIGANLQSSVRVSVTVRSGGGVGFSGVLLQMHQRLLCYQPLASEPLLLLYGNAEARPQRYDYAAHYRPAAVPLLAVLGATRANPEYHTAAKTGFRLTRLQRLVLAAGIAVASFLLTAVPLLRRS